MTEEIKNNLIHAVKMQLGMADDNLSRAKLAFAHMSEAQLHQPYLGSTSTPQEMLDGYQKSYNKWAETLKWIQ